MAVSFDFSQVTKLADDLGKAGAAITALNESRVLDRTAREVQSEAIQMAPRLTGALAGSITLGGGRGFRVVGSPLKQGFFQEFGTSRHPPQPWLMPAADKAGGRMVDRLKEIANPLD